MSKKPRILVNIHGGLVQDVYVDGEVEDVIVVDWDQEGATDEDMAKDDCLFKDHKGAVGRAYSAGFHPWKSMNEFPEMEMAALFAAGWKRCSYTSIWDGKALESAAMANLETRELRIFEFYADNRDLEVLEDKYVVFLGDDARHPVVHADEWRDLTEQEKRTTFFYN